jgi:putative two-component system response regulator
MDTSDTSRRATILVVDDTPDNLTLMSQLLQSLYKVKVANSGVRALKVIASGAPPDLILLDIMMPEMDGYEVCQRLKQSPQTQDIPIIFLTAKATEEDEERGLKLGAVDYITKPISPPIVLARVKAHLSLKAAADFLRDKNEFLEEEIQRRIEEVMIIQDVTIHVMASLAETRDLETGGHIQRTQFYVKAIAEKLSTDPRFAVTLSKQIITTIYKSSSLHDIGKVGIPDSILLKPGRLTDDEFEIMKTHTTLGFEAIARAEQQLGIKVDFLDTAKKIALSHHEKWNGSGYPKALKGAEIPLAARLMAVADVFDALTSRRIYKEAMSFEDSLKIMQEGRGTHFDPDVLDAFLSIQDEVQSIANRYRDTETEIVAKREMVGENS